MDVRVNAWVVNAMTDRARGSVSSQAVQSRAAHDAAALMCEACGYDLSAVEAGAGEGAGGGAEFEPATGRCPECGTLVSASLPSVRIGTRWQRRPGLATWARTGYDVLRHPKVTFRFLKVERRGALLLLVINAVLAGFFLADPWVGVLAGDPVRLARGTGFEVVAQAAGYMVYVGALAAAIMVLTYVEFRGIRFIAQRRGWRLSRDAAWQVCAHASVGWMFCGLLSLLGMAAMTGLALRTKLIPQSHLDLSPVLPVRMMWHDAIGGVLVIGGYLAGLIIFETLVYVGVRQCRFANPPQAR